MKAKNVWVHLADDEWGNVLMEAVALETLEKYPQADMVTVHEHAGWWLAWNREGDIVGTANDAASRSPEGNRFWDHHDNDYEIIANIRRESTPVPAEAACEVPV